MTEPTRTIKIYEKTHPKLKILAATTGETMMDLVERLVTRQEKQAMQKQMYSVKVNGDVLYHDLFKNEAISIAKREAEAGNQVFITWFRKADGQHGHLNGDGNHDVTGTAW